MAKVYSFLDHRVVLSHPDVGTMVLSEGGIGRIVVSYTGENSRITTAADGSAVVNKMEGKSGTVTIDVLQTSEANRWLTKFTNYLNNAPSNRFALGSLVITAPDGENTTCNAVVPQKMADTVYDAEAQTRSWAMLAAEIDMK